MLSFFGQFMVEEGLIDKSALREALTLMAKTNRTIGELAIEAGYLSGKDAERINSEQRLFDLYFGELAVHKGLLTHDQVQQLLQSQKQHHLRIGDALLQVGCVEPSQIEKAFEKFHHASAQKVLEEAAMPPKLLDDRVFMYVLDYLPRLVLRMASRPLKIGRATAFRSLPAYDHVATVYLRGDAGLDISLEFSPSLGEGIARHMFGLGQSDFAQETISDALLEVLDILAANAENYARGHGVHILFDPPHSGVRIESGFFFPLVTPDGLGVFVLHKETHS